MAFSASEAAFEGFRILRREPGTAAVWVALMLALAIVSVLVLAPAFRGYATTFVPGGTPTAAQMSAVTHMLWLELAIAPVYLVIYSVFTAAVYRAVLRPEDKGLARLRLGGDELRLIGLYLILGLFLFGVFMVLAIVVGVAAGVAFAASGTSNTGAVVWVFIVIYAVLIATWAWLGVKFSFAAPMTFTQKRIQVFGSWRATKGRYWPLLGCYLLTFVFLFLILCLNLVVSGALMFGAAGGSFSRLAAGLIHPDPASTLNLLSPIYLGRVVVGAVFGVVMWIVALAPAARAYREIVGLGSEDQAEAFS